MRGFNNLRWDLGEGGEGQKCGSKGCLNERRDEAHLDARMSVVWIKECRDKDHLLGGEESRCGTPVWNILMYNVFSVPS